LGWVPRFRTGVCIHDDRRGARAPFTHTVVEPVTGIGDPCGYYIHEKRLRLEGGGLLWVTVGLAPAPAPLARTVRPSQSASV
jgi:hypothetical protein